MFLKLTDQYGKTIILNTAMINYVSYVNGHNQVYDYSQTDYTETKNIAGVHVGGTLFYLSEESSSKLQTKLGVNNE
jgi:hypothetical protein